MPEKTTKVERRQIRTALVDTPCVALSPWARKSLTPDLILLMASRPYISVIVPAYNEEERLPETLSAIQTFLEGRSFEWELIVADDGSTDRTVEVAKQAFRSDCCRVLAAERNGGKGSAIRRGMLEAAGRYRLFTDADNSTPIEELPRIVRAMKRRGADIGIGSRGLPSSRIEVHQPFYRELMGRVFNLIVQAFALPGLKDTQCGFKVFSSEAARSVFPRQSFDGFSFDVEILYIARREGFRIVEVPVRWINSPASRVSPVRDSLNMFLDVLKIRRLHG